MTRAHASGREVKIDGARDKGTAVAVSMPIEKGHREEIVSEKKILI